MRRNSWCLWLGLAAALWARRSLAEEPVARIEVRADTVSAAEARAPTSFVTVIDTADRGDQGETVTDALSESVGVNVRRFGGLGAFSTVSIRGSAANQVQVYLDGVPLSRARNEALNLGDLPLDGLERIEVYRGTVPVGFGPAGIGGVVNLVTKPPTATPTTELATSFGSFFTRKLVASHSRRARGVDLLAHVTYLGTDGDFSFFDDNGTPLQPADDETATRRNNEFDSVDALLKAGYSINAGLRLDLTNETYFKDQGVPGIGNTQSRTASFTELRSLTYLRLAQTGWLDDRLDLSGTLFGIYQREQLDDRDEDLKIGPQDRDDQTGLVGGDVTATFYPVPSHAVGWFTELSHERFSGENDAIADGDEPDQTRLRVSLAVEDQAAFFGERLIVVPSFRYEHVRDRISERLPVGQTVGDPQTETRDLWSPALGVQVRPLAWLAFRGNLGRYERPPNFTELFGIRGAVSGSEDLKSERAFNRDVGLVVSWDEPSWLDRLRLEYVYFDNDVDDIIVLVPVNSARFAARNIGAAHLRGHEFVLNAALLEHLAADLNYTHQDAEDRGKDPNRRGNQLPLRPEDELYLRFETFADAWKLYYELSFVAGNFRDPANFDEIPARDIHTLGLAVTPLEWLQLTFEARNLTDDQISDVAGFPLPGLSFFGTVRVRL